MLQIPSSSLAEFIDINLRILAAFPRKYVRTAKLCRNYEEYNLFFFLRPVHFFRRNIPTERRFRGNLFCQNLCSNGMKKRIR